MVIYIYIQYTILNINNKTITYKVSGNICIFISYTIHHSKNHLYIYHNIFHAK